MVSATKPHEPGVAALSVAHVSHAYGARKALDDVSFTVPQGTVLPAVLETALDSTRPGAVLSLIHI